MALSVHSSAGGSGKQTVVGFHLVGRAGATQGCVTIPIDVGSSARKVFFALHEASTTYTSQGGIYGSNDDATYTKIVAFSNYGTQWNKAGMITGYRYYRLAFSTSGGTSTTFGIMCGALSYDGETSDSKNIDIRGGTNNTNHIYATNGNINSKDTETLTSLVDKSIITNW